MSGADAAGPVADSAIEDLRAVREALQRDLLRILLQLDTNPGEDSLVRRQGQTAVAVYRQVEQRLAALGDEVASVAGARAVEAVAAVVGAPPATLPLDVRQELDQIVDGQIGDVVAVFRAANEDIRQAVARGITTGGSLADLVSSVAVKLDTSVKRAQFAVDAAVMAAGRRAVVSIALDVEEGEGERMVFVYVGPRDGKNRPFCRQWVGKAVVDPRRLDNGQDLPVEDFCGGYNCRHSWAPTPIPLAIDEGYRIYDVDGSGDPVDVTSKFQPATLEAQNVVDVG
jgi:hypothetical protein